MSNSLCRRQLYSRCPASVKALPKHQEGGNGYRVFCDSRVDHVSYDMFREMVNAGCICIFFGIESGNQRILDYYKKGITPEQSEKAVRKARNAGIDIIVGSFIVGAPDETQREIINTLQFANKLDIDVPDVNILGAQTGTDLWNDLVARVSLMRKNSGKMKSVSPEMCQLLFPTKK